MSVLDTVQKLWLLDVLIALFQENINLNSNKDNVG